MTAGKKTATIKIAELTNRLTLAKNKAIDKFNEMTKSSGEYNGDEAVLIAAITDIYKQELSR